MQVCQRAESGWVHRPSRMAPDQLQKVPLQVLHLRSSQGASLSAGVQGQRRSAALQSVMRIMGSILLRGTVKGSMTWVAEPTPGLCGWTA